MKFIKEVDGKEVIIECTHDFLESFYVREGFKEVKEIKTENKHK